jgi:hypothetical protein
VERQEVGGRAHVGRSAPGAARGMKSATCPSSKPASEMRGAGSAAAAPAAASWAWGETHGERKGPETFECPLLGRGADDGAPHNRHDRDCSVVSGASRRRACPPQSPPPPRTKWTRRVPHPVLIGHAAVRARLSQGEPRHLQLLALVGEPPRPLHQRGEHASGGGPLAVSRAAPRPARHRTGPPQRPRPPPPRTKWTNRVPHPVLIGHAASLSQVAPARHLLPGKERLCKRRQTGPRRGCGAGAGAGAGSAAARARAARSAAPRRSPTAL